MDERDGYGMGVVFLNDENILKSIMVMAAQL